MRNIISVPTFRRPQQVLFAFLIFVALTVPTYAHSQDGLILAAKASSAILDSKTAGDTLDKLRTAASEAMAGQTPTMSSDWDKIGMQYDQAATNLRAAPLPTALIPTTNVVSVAEYTNCTTRPGAIVKLNGYLTDMQNAQTAGQATVTNLDAFAQRLVQAHAAVDYLARVHLDLAKIPVIGDQFALDWLSLDRYVGPALGRLDSATQDQKKRITENLALLATEISNYQANLTTINGLSVCSPLAGNWAGNGTPASVRFGGPPYCYYNTTMDQVHVNVSIDQNGHVTSGSGSAVMHETLAVQCSIQPGGTRGQTYLFQSGNVSGTNVHVNFVTPNGSGPKCTADFNGTVVDHHLSGTFSIHRIDGGPRLNWNTAHLIH